MKTRKAGILIKIVVVVLFIYAVVTLMSLRTQIESAEEQKALLESQVTEQTEINAELADDIENSDDPEKIKEIAREKLGLIGEGEKVFYDVSN